MNDEDKIARLQRLVRRMEAHDAASRVLHSTLPEFEQVAMQFDKSVADGLKRKRGERTKLNGGILFEQAAVDLVKTIKDLLKRDGIPTFDAWEEARWRVGKIIKVSPATLKEWGRGAPKRERKKPLAQRSYRRRLKKRNSKPD